MKPSKLLLLSLTLFLALPAAPQQARSNVAASAPTAVPPLIPYSGVVNTVPAAPPAADASITFLIYKDEQGGEPLFAETQTVAVDATGHYKTQLGATLTNGIPIDLFATGEARWLEVQAAGEAPQPRVLLVSVPYALKAADAATLGGLPPSAFALARSASGAAGRVSPAIMPNLISNVTTTGGTANRIPKFSGSNTIVNSLLFDSGTAVGIGTTTPTATLTIEGAMTVVGTSTLNGQVLLLPQGTATASKGFNSQIIKLSSSAFNSSSNSVVSPRFQLQVEPTGNNIASPNATLNLLASATASAPAETGFFVNTNGTIHFAPGQTFPGGVGTGTITGVTPGAGLTGGGTSGNVMVKVAVPLSLSASVDGDNGVIVGATTGSGSGIYGKSVTGYGVYGNSDNNIGVHGTGPAGGGGVSAYGGRVGLLSVAYNTVGTADGVNTTGANGVFAVSNRAGGSGVVGEASNNSTDDYGIWGLSDSGNAGAFNGNVNIIGTLTKSAGTFRIDHPLDPENKYLSHSFVESPDMMNIYNGIAALDGNGEATVQLPYYFAALNKDYRYQLTAMGAPGPNLYIAEEIANNQFKIAGGKGGMKVSWQVTGIRQDAYANAHRTPVEEDKPGKEKGTYLHPDLFGQSEEKGREWAVHPEVMKRMKQDREKDATVTQAFK